MNIKSEKEYLDQLQDNVLQLFYDAVDANLLNFKYCSFFIKAMNSQQKAAEIRQYRIDKGLPAPPIMICSVTGRCNLNCTGCYVMSQKNDRKSEMSPENFDKLFTEAHKIGTRIVLLTGGEPLLRQDILKTASRHSEILFPVLTNGLLLDREKIRFFSKNKNLVPVLSMEKNHMGINELSEEDIYADFDSILELMRRQKMFYGLTIKLTRDNYQHALDPIRLKEYYEKGCRLFFYVENLHDSLNRITEKLSPEQQAEIPEKLKQINKDIPAFHITLPGGNDQYGGCLSAGRGFIHVSAGGNLEPCPYVPYSDTSILDVPLNDALNSSFLHRIRSQHHLLYESKNGCALRNNREIIDECLRGEGVLSA